MPTYLINPANQETTEEDAYSLALRARASSALAQNDDLPSRPAFTDYVGGISTRTAVIELLNHDRGYSGDLPLDAQPTIRKPYPWG